MAEVIVIRRTPGQVIVRMMPRQVYAKGRVLSADDGKPLAKAWVSLGRRKPGDTNANYGSARTVLADADGNFSLQPAPPGFSTDDAGWPSAWHDIEKGLQPRTGGEDYSKLLQHYGPMWDFAVGVGGIWYPISPGRIVTSVDEGIHTYMVIRHPAKDKPPHPNPITAEQRGLAGTQSDTPTTQPTEPPPTPPPSGTVSLTGEWDINANNARGKITIIQQDGNQFSGRIFSEQLVNSRINGSKKTFTRLWSSGFRQDYTGTIGTGPDGRTIMTGSFTQQGTGSHNWTATRTGAALAAITPVATTQARFTVEAGKRNVSQGGSVTVPVSFNNVEGLANMNVNIHYDPAVVKPARNASRGNIIPQSLFEANVRDRGVIRLGFAQQTDILGTGTLAPILFEAVGRTGSWTALRIEVTTASTAAGSRVTPAQLIHGEITIVGADGRLPGDTSGTGELTALDAINALKMSVGNLAVDMVADVDRDGSVTARDATQIQQQVVRR